MQCDVEPIDVVCWCGISQLSWKLKVSWVRTCRPVWNHLSAEAEQMPQGFSESEWHQHVIEQSVRGPVTFMTVLCTFSQLSICHLKNSFSMHSVTTMSIYTMAHIEGNLLVQKQRMLICSEKKALKQCRQMSYYMIYKSFKKGD